MLPLHCNIFVNMFMCAYNKSVTQVLVGFSSFFQSLSLSLGLKSQSLGLSLAFKALGLGLSLGAKALALALPWP